MVDQNPSCTSRHWRWERLFAFWSRCGWTKWREDAHLEGHVHQLPRAVGFDKYHLFLPRRRESASIPGSFRLCLLCGSFCVFPHPESSMCRGYQWEPLCLIWFWWHWPLGHEVQVFSGGWYHMHKRIMNSTRKKRALTLKETFSQSKCLWDVATQRDGVWPSPLQPMP